MWRTRSRGAGSWERSQPPGLRHTVINGLTASRAKAATPKTGGRLVVGVEAAQAQDSLDPTKYFSTSNIQMGYAVHDNLVNRDENLQPMPWLATSWEANEDASAWVFNLREGRYLPRRV